MAEEESAHVRSEVRSALVPPDDVVPSAWFLRSGRSSPILVPPGIRIRPFDAAGGL